VRAEEAERLLDAYVDVDAAYGVEVPVRLGEAASTYERAGTVEHAWKTMRPDLARTMWADSAHRPAAGAGGRVGVPVVSRAVGTVRQHGTRARPARPVLHAHQGVVPRRLRTTHRGTGGCVARDRIRCARARRGTDWLRQDAVRV